MPSLYISYCLPILIALFLLSTTQQLLASFLIIFTISFYQCLLVFIPYPIFYWILLVFYQFPFLILFSIGFYQLFTNFHLLSHFLLDPTGALPVLTSYFTLCQILLTLYPSQLLISFSARFYQYFKSLHLLLYFLPHFTSPASFYCTLQYLLALIGF